MLQIQVLLFGTFWNFFLFKYFWSSVGWIHRCRTYTLGGVNVLKLFFFLVLVYKEQFVWTESPWISLSFLVLFKKWCSFLFLLCRLLERSLMPHWFFSFVSYMIFLPGGQRIFLPLFLKSKSFIQICPRAVHYQSIFQTHSMAFWYIDTDHFLFIDFVCITVLGISFILYFVFLLQRFQ